MSILLLVVNGGIGSSNILSSMAILKIVLEHWTLFSGTQQRTVWTNSLQKSSKRHSNVAVPIFFKVTFPRSWKRNLVVLVLLSSISAQISTATISFNIFYKTVLIVFVNKSPCTFENTWSPFEEVDTVNESLFKSNG
jgi:hypothetical protein